MTAAGNSPTRVRYGVLAFVCTLSMITYLDRACFGTAQDSIRAALGLQSIDELRLAFTAFTLAYAIFEVPTGWLGDVFGPRATLIRIVLWWSIFTALTALAGLEVGGTVLVSFGTLVAIRFLFGVGEAGAYPNITRALHNWFPAGERGSAQGLVWMSGRLMGGLTPLIWGGLVYGLGLSWRTAFVLFGLLGVAWCAAFAGWFRNRPEEKPEVSPAELELIRTGADGARESAHARVPWRTLLRSGNLWALCAMYFCMAYGWYFNIFYLPAYLEEQHGVAKNSELGNLLKGAPLLFGAVGCWLGGRLTDQYLQRTGNRKTARRLFGMIGHGLCVPLYIACIYAPGPWTFALAIGLTGFCNDLAMGSAWSICQDIGRRHAAIVAGCMNTIGNLGGAVSSWVIGEFLLVSRTRATPVGTDFSSLTPAARAEALLPGYEWNFLSFAGLYLAAMMLWLLIDANRPVIPEDG